MRRTVVKDHPELFLPLPPRPGEDARLSLLLPLEDPLIRKILPACPAIATLQSDTGYRLRGVSLPKEQLPIWSGKNLIPARHQIVVERLSNEDIKKRHEAMATLARDASLSPTLATVLYGRGITTKEPAQKFIAPDIQRELSRLPIYSALEHAGSILASAIKEQLRIAIVADYDADGNCAAATMKRAIEMCGGSCAVIQPDRVRDGYGLSDSTLERVKQTVPNLVLTLDLGTSNKAQIKKLNDLGVITIVVDHHELQGTKTAEPYLLVNPKSDPALKDYEALCASGLSWLLARSLLSHNYEREGLTALTNELLPLAAIGTVADVMELSGLNRAIAWHGHALLPKSQIPALQALYEIKRDGKITGDFVGYHIGPTLNACGRISPAEGERPGTAPVFNFLTTHDAAHAVTLYDELSRVNDKRKLLEREGLEEAQKLVKKYVAQKVPVHCGVVLPIEGVHEGVVGLMAARLCESMQCPVVVLTRDIDGNWKGSGRSTPQVSLIKLLRHPELAELINECGGHDAAAGLRIGHEKVAEFQTRFNRICTEIFCGPANAQSDHADKASEPSPLPKVDKWLKEYRPDLIMTVDEYVARRGELVELCSTLEPCGRGNAPLRVLLPRVRISSVQETPNKHLRLTLQDATAAGTTPHAQSSLEVVAFARSLASRILEHRKGPTEILDVIIQPAVDTSVATVGTSPSLQGNVLLVQPTSFLCDQPGYPKPPEPKQERKEPKQPVNTDLSLLSRKDTVPSFSSIDDFCKHFGITCLRNDNLTFIEPQIQFVTKLLLAQEKSPNRNVLYKVNTGGGKTIIAFLKLAQILSRDPKAKVLYLAPQNDLVEQTLNRARTIFNLRADEIVTVSGETSAAERKEIYSGSGRLYIGTPHTAKNDGDLSPFSFVILDEIHFMRGDNSIEEDTRYPYRWVVEQCHSLADGGHPIRFWAQSGTPAANPRLLRELLQTLRGMYEQTYIPSGAHTWRPHHVELDDEYRLHLTHLRDAYRAALKELVSFLPSWSHSQQFDSSLSLARQQFKRAVLHFLGLHPREQAHHHTATRTLPSRSEFNKAREALIVELKQAIERGQKYNAQVASGVQKKNLSWIYDATSRLHELDHVLRCFEDLRSKGRSALSLSLSPRILTILNPESKKTSDGTTSSTDARPKPYGFGFYHVRFLRRPELQETLAWVMEESTPARLLSEFRKVYPKRHSIESSTRDSFRFPEIRSASWQKLLDYSEADVPTSKRKRSPQSIRSSVLNQRLIDELKASGRIDCVERALRRLLHTLPENAKIMIQCDEKTETKLLCERLKAARFKAAWYAGKSVPKSEKLKDNLQAFKDGAVRILCCTSVGDTGHDIPSVTHSIRLVPLTSPIRNAQSRGRTARKEGLRGTYITMIVSDPDGDFDESKKYIIARQRERTMNSI